MSTFKFVVLAALLYLVGAIGVAHAQQPALRFMPLPPCRIADTRDPNGPFGGPSIAGNFSRSFTVPSSACGVPGTAAAYSLNVTAVPHGHLGYLTIWPTGQSQPLVSTLNATDGRVKANAAIVPAGTGGAISVFVTDIADVVLDINGYFVAATDSSALAFFPLTPCRIADTRDPSGALGGPSLVGMQARSFPVQSSSCGIPASAMAYSLNFTAVAPNGLGYLSTWPSGMTQPTVSTLNAPTGQVTANAAIVPAGVGGAISVLASNNADVIIDVNGYFAAAASGPNGLSLYTLTPCRVLDTRNTTGLFSGTLANDTTASPCGLIPNALAVVLNATVVPAQPLSFLSLWPSGQPRPWVSTLNAGDGLITSNMAIVPTTSGAISAYATDSTQLVQDTSGYFASGTAPAPTTYTVTVGPSTSGSGRGVITSIDGKVNCGGVCSVSYLSGAAVTLTATPAIGSEFAGWTGACTGSGTCSVTMNSAQSATAIFNVMTGCPAVPGVRSLWINPGAGPSVISASSPDGLYSLFGGTLNATPGTYSVTSSTATLPNTFVMASVGPVCGLGGINSIPTTGYQASLTLQAGYGYVGSIGDGTYVRFYVTSAVAGPVIGLQYEYPMTICPSSTHWVFGKTNTYNGVASKVYAQNSTGSVTNYAFVGCRGTATVRAWAGGGAGGQATISFYGGNGGGGGGGGGYGMQSISMIPGQWYVVSVGMGGSPNWPVSSGFGTGGSSGFALEAGSSFFVSSGGQQGTDAGSGTTVGKGGAPGSSNATTSSPGVAGSDGQTNYNRQLCGGGGAIGPGGAGGAGGGGGGTGGSGGCSPGAPSPPGGGGSGASQLGQSTSGAMGQVAIDY